MKKAEEDSIKALELLYSSPIGIAVMQNLRDHSQPSKKTNEMVSGLHKRINKLVILVFSLIIGGGFIGGVADWAIFQKAFSGYEANIKAITIQMNIQNQEIYELKQILSNFSNK